MSLSKNEQTSITLRSSVYRSSTWNELANWMQWRKIDLPIAEAAWSCKAANLSPHGIADAWSSDEPHGRDRVRKNQASSGLAVTSISKQALKLARTHVVADDA